MVLGSMYLQNWAFCWGEILDHVGIHIPAPWSDGNGYPKTQPSPPLGVDGSRWTDLQRNTAWCYKMIRIHHDFSNGDVCFCFKYPLADEHNYGKSPCLMGESAVFSIAKCWFTRGYHVVGSFFQTPNIRRKNSLVRRRFKVLTTKIIRCFMQDLATFKERMPKGVPYC